MQTVITVEDVSMNYRMSADKVDSLKEFAIRYFQRKLRFEEFCALQNINLTVEKGEVLGIVGFNGSGKSTLLKLISGILKPTAGRVEVRGAISPLIELGAGFDPDLTARENVFLNGAALGFSHREMTQRYDDIIKFAELEKFQDVAIKSFSSGMTARLGFSVATAVQPEVLIIDEILGVGDFRFREKSEQRIHEMMSGGTTVLLVSHAIPQIEQLCTRAIWLDQGVLRLAGTPAEVCAAYREAGAK